MINMQHKKSDTLNKDQIEWCTLLTYFNRVKPDTWININEFNKAIKSRNERLIKQVPLINVTDLKILQKRGYINLVIHKNENKNTEFYGRSIVQFKLKGDVI